MLKLRLPPSRSPSLAVTTQAVVEPGDGVGLAEQVGQAARWVEQAVVLGVHVDEIHGAGRKVVNDLGRGQVDEDDVVVLLQGHCRHVEMVDAHEFRLWIGGANRESPVRSTVRKVQFSGAPSSLSTCSAPPGSCGSSPSSDLFVALVLDDDGGESAIRAHRHRIGLAEERNDRARRAGRHVLGACVETEHGQVTGRRREAGGRVHHHQ